LGARAWVGEEDQGAVQQPGAVHCAVSGSGIAYG
jgi:hypothetical protein